MPNYAMVAPILHLSIKKHKYTRNIGGYNKERKRKGIKKWPQLFGES